MGYFFNFSSLYTRWVSVVEFHDPTLSIGKVFGQESTVVKWSYQILHLHQVTFCQKLSDIIYVRSLSLKIERNNPWFKPWFKILLPTQSIVCATV